MIKNGKFSITGYTIYPSGADVQNGSPLYELQKLEDSSSWDIVHHYAHLNSNYLKKAADRLITGTKLAHEPMINSWELAECS